MAVTLDSNLSTHKGKSRWGQSTCTSENRYGTSETKQHHACSPGTLPCFTPHHYHHPQATATKIAEANWTMSSLSWLGGGGPNEKLSSFNGLAERVTSTVQGF